jgi:hypothetical protein
MRMFRQSLTSVGSVATVALALALGLAWMQPTARGVTALSDNTFLNSIGINATGGTAPAVAADLSYMGIRWERYIVTNPATLSDFMTPYDLQVHQLDPNVKFDVCMQPGMGANQINLLCSAGEALNGAGCLLAFEGPSDVENDAIWYNGASGGGGGNWMAAAEYQRDMYAAVHSDPNLAGIPVFNLTDAGYETSNLGLQYLTIPAGAGTLMPDGTTYADYLNVHNYGATAAGYVNNTVWNAINVWPSPIY